MIAKTIGLFGKYLDQPAIVKQMYKNTPAVLAGGAILYGLDQFYKAPKDERDKAFVKNFFVLSGTIAGALLGTRGLNIGGKQIIKSIIHKDHSHIHKHLPQVFDALKSKFTEASKVFEDSKKIIEKIHHEKYIKFSELKTLNRNLEEAEPNKKLIDMLISKPHKHGAKDIINEMAALSYIGLVPILGGIAGGVVSDYMIHNDWKKRLPDKLKEGSYQYLSNIFLCNVGAGGALIAMDKMGVKSKPVKLAGALAGVGVVGIGLGSQLANLFGKKVLNPLLGGKQSGKPKTFKEALKDINSERVPELIDASLHIDDVASVGFLSGLKWVGPALPFFYSVSAYRAGVGYRNRHAKEESIYKTLRSNKPENLKTYYADFYK